LQNQPLVVQSRPLSHRQPKRPPSSVFYILGGVSLSERERDGGARDGRKGRTSLLMQGTHAIFDRNEGKALVVADSGDGMGWRRGSGKEMKSRNRDKK